jgi:hypothetical protein
MRTPLRLSSKKLTGAEGMAFAPDEAHLLDFLDFASLPVLKPPLQRN